VPWHQRPWDGTVLEISLQDDSEVVRLVSAALDEDQSGEQLYRCIRERAATISYATFREIMEAIREQAAKSEALKAAAIRALTLLLDRRYDPGDKKRSNLLHLIMETLTKIFQNTPAMGENQASRYRRIDWDSRNELAAPHQADAILVIDAAGFPRKVTTATPD